MCLRPCQIVKTVFQLGFSHHSTHSPVTGRTLVSLSLCLSAHSSFHRDDRNQSPLPHSFRFVRQLGASVHESSTKEKEKREEKKSLPLVESRDTSTLVDLLEGGYHVILAVGSEVCLDDLEGLAQGCDLEHVHGGTDTEIGKVDLLLGGSGARDGCRRSDSDSHDVTMLYGLGWFEEKRKERKERKCTAVQGIKSNKDEREREREGGRE